MSESVPQTDAEIIAREFKEFASIISHDLRAPLRAVIQFSKLVNDEYAAKLDEEGQMYLNLIQDSGKKLQDMLDGILEHSRLSTTGKPRSSQDSSTLVQQAISTLEKSTGLHGATIDITGPLPSIHANPEQFQRLVFILLENAVRFATAGEAAHIKISAEKQNDFWLFSVCDNGIGIEDMFHERIFLPFRKLHTDSEFPGLGMGLAIAKKIVEIHGGTLRVDSQKGKGSTFQFTIACGD